MNLINQIPTGEVIKKAAFLGSLFTHYFYFPRLERDKNQSELRGFQNADNRLTFGIF
jgi:hypothetical protein